MSDNKDISSISPLRDVICSLGQELARVQSQLTQLEQVFFGWLASSQRADSMPLELHKLDLTVQSIGELRRYLDVLSESVPSHLKCDVSRAVSEVRLEAMRDRLNGIQPDTLAHGSGSVPPVELF